MGRTQNLLDQKRNRGAASPRSIDSDTRPTPSKKTASGGSRTQRLLAQQDTTPEKTTPKLAAGINPAAVKPATVVAPYAMRREATPAATPYAAGLQARQAAEMPKREKTDPAQPSFAQRVLNTVSGGLKGTGASMTDMIGTLYEMGQKGRDKQNQALLEEYASNLEYAQRQLDAALEDIAKDPGAWSQGDIQSFYNVRDDAQLKYDAVAKVFDSEVQKGTTQATYDAADQLQRSSAQDIERAKQGLGTAGQMLVDAGASMAQTVGDAVGGAATGNGMIPFVMRAFGGGTQKARQDGADLGGQVAHGAASAAKEYVTEKMFGIALPFNKIYGGGSMDDAVERVIRNAADKLASSPQGQKALGGLFTLLASGWTEGLEEFVGKWMEWQMPRIYGGDVDTAEETLVNSLYDFAVGGITGLMGGTLSVGQYTPHNMDGDDGAALLRQAAQEAAEMAAAARDTQDTQDTQAVQAQKTAPEQGAEGPKSTIERAADGTTYVQISADILEGHPESEWGNIVREEIKKIFAGGLRLKRGEVLTNRKGRGEFSNGSYTKMLERTDPEMYADKMRMAAGSDSIVRSAQDVAYEGAGHDRTDDIVGFNRGRIQVSVRGAGYAGDVLTAIYSDGKETFFDINNLKRKTITAASPERYTAQDGFTQTDGTAVDPIIPSPGDGVNTEYAQAEALNIAIRALLDGSAVSGRMAGAIPVDPETAAILEQAAETAAAAQDTQGIQAPPAAPVRQVWNDRRPETAPEEAAEQMKALQGGPGDGTMGAMDYLLKEDPENGRARKETREDFKRRCLEKGYQFLETSGIGYGFRRVRDSAEKGDRGRVTPEAQEAQGELKTLGIDADIVDGPVLINRNGITTTRDVPEAVTVDRSHIFINKNTAISPRNAAGHEAFHLWKSGTGRDAYVEIVEDNLLFSSEAFLEYQSAIAEVYLGGEADLADAAQADKLFEELFAYISGDIHEGGHEAELAPMFRNFDAVKAAWEKLVRENSAGQDITPSASQDLEYIKPRRPGAPKGPPAGEFPELQQLAHEMYLAGKAEGVSAGRGLGSGEGGSVRTSAGGVTAEEEAALLTYKSGGSYRMNALLLTGSELDEYYTNLRDELDAALKKLPVHTGRVYRNLGFDDFGGKEEMDAFVAQHMVGVPVNYGAYTSASKSVDGHPIDGEYIVNLVIESATGKELAGYGNNSEQEVLFERDAVFIPTEITVGEDGHPLIYMKEDARNGAVQ